MQVTEYMRREILTKNEKIARLEQELDKQKRAAETHAKTSESASERAELEAQIKYEELDSSMTARLREATEQLAAVTQFQAVKEDMEGEALQLREEVEGMGKALDEGARESDRRFLEGTTKLKKEFEQRLEEMKKRCAAAAVDG